MRVELPNGRIIEDVPDGTSKEEIKAKAIAAGIAAESDFPSPEQQPSFGFMDRINQLVLDTPGGKELSELAAAANKSIFSMIDFFGVDNVNAVLDLAGSNKRLATASGTLASNGGYMEEGLGRDIVQAVGSTLPAAVTAGQVSRDIAAKLPKMAAGESAGAGVVRQAGQSTVKQDVGTAVLSATGGEVGEEVGGDTGKLVGSALAPFATVAPAAVKSITAGQSARKALENAAPSSQELKTAAREVYKQLDDAGVVYSEGKLRPFIQQTINKVKREGFNSKIHPKVSAALDELAKGADSDLTLTELDTLRKVSNAAARSIDPDEARLGGMITERIDDFMANTSTNASQGGTDEVGQLFTKARNLWGKARRTELIDEAIEKAQNQASGFENGLRTQFRSILNNKKKMRGFSPDERAAIKKIVQGGRLENTAKALGKFGFSEGQATSMMLSSLGAAGGAAVAGPGGAAAVPLAGQAFKSIAQKLTRDNALLAKRLVSAGSNGEKIARAYMASKPSAKRSTEELTALLIEGKVPTEKLRESSNKLIADAAYLASVWRSVVPADAAQDDELEQQD